MVSFSLSVVPFSSAVSTTYNRRLENGFRIREHLLTLDFERGILLECGLYNPTTLQLYNPTTLQLYNPTTLQLAVQLHNQLYAAQLIVQLYD